MTNIMCSVQDCPAPKIARGWCRNHYYRWLRNGDPMIVKLDRSKSPADRFWEKVCKDTPSGCWTWLAYVDPKGYGRFTVNGRTIAAHQWSYLDAFGPVPVGLEIDHLCHNRSCVNPAHLEAVTHEVNMERSNNFMLTNAQKTHCPHGHAYTDDNVYLKPSGGRQCRACDRARRQVSA